MNNLILLIASIPIIFISCFPSISGQQNYTRRTTTSCHTTDTSTSALGYTCGNALSQCCRAYLTFRAHPPFNSIPAVSNLLSVSPSRLARLNSLPPNTTLETNRMLLVPIQCSCSGDHHYYQANTSFRIEHNDTYFLIANNTFQGLSTCQALKAQNSNRSLTKNLYTGTRITVPLRCACPSKNQTTVGVKYLLTYLITWKESVSSISALFEVDTSSTLAANELSEQDFTIYPFTTLLIPLKNPPSSTRVSSVMPPPRSVNPPPPSGGSTKPWIYIVVSLVLASVIVAAIVFFVNQKPETRPVVTSENSNSLSAERGAVVDRETQDFLESITKVYTIEELKTATQDFSTDFVIKGSVYRGRINGDMAAIKKMSGDVSKEIKILSKINHFNLIRLSGACFSQGFWYFVYEYAANGSLRDWIHRSDGYSRILNWNERLRIVLDVATGLSYLHNYASPQLVHKDVNSSNVVLDQDLRAKITNFGLARAAEGQEDNFALTKHVVGTKGFIAPEYLEMGLVSPMVDVYAFGVVMLEIFTGKEASLQLSEILVEENVGKLMDPLLEGNYPPQIAVLVMELIDKFFDKNFEFHIFQVITNYINVMHLHVYPCLVLCFINIIPF